MAQQPTSLEVGGLEMDRRRFEVTVLGTPVRVTRREFELLWLLASRRGRIFHRDEIIELVWGADYFIGLRAVDVVVARIRRKLKAAAPHLTYLETVWGIGYRLHVREVPPSPSDE
jgi:DNA-binding response OmpR family regulator